MATTDRLRAYRAGRYPQLGDNGTYLTGEFNNIAETLATLVEVLVLLDTTATLLTNAANDVAAAAAGVPVGGLYHNSGAVRVRLT